MLGRMFSGELDNSTDAKVHCIQQRPSQFSGV